MSADACRPLVLAPHEVRAALRGPVLIVRAVKPQPEHRQVYDWRGQRLHDSEYRHWCWRGHVGADNWDDITQQLGHACPLGTPGTRLWVREAWGEHPTAGGGSDVIYAADYRDGSDRVAGARYRSPVVMSRWASRLTVEVESVEVRRVSTITDEEARACGDILLPVGNGHVMQPPARYGFRLWWEAKRSWEDWAWFCRVRACVPPSAKDALGKQLDQRVGAGMARRNP